MRRCCPRRGRGSCGAVRPAELLTAQDYCNSLKRNALSTTQGHSAMFFPMYVVRVQDFLSMTEAKKHQALKSAGLVQEYDEGRLGPAVFVSHQWCGRSHPDPHFLQLLVLQGLLRRLHEGKLQVEVELMAKFAFPIKSPVTAYDLKPLATGCLWYDFFSVPQPKDPLAHSDLHTRTEHDLGKAVDSIPAYVELCKFFLILAPPVAHADDQNKILDYQSWKSRGWCRLERVARALSPAETHVLLAWKEDTLHQVGAQDYLIDAVGDGTFSVEEDRNRLAKIVVAALELKLQALLQEGDMRGYRRLLSSREMVLHGLPGVCPRMCCAPGFRVPAPFATDGAEERVRAFLRLYGFASPTDLGGGTAEPILFAAAGGDPDLVEALLERRANLHAKEGASDHEYCAIKGRTPLHVAAAFSREPGVVAALLRHRADLEATQEVGSTPLLEAAFSGCPEVLAALLDAKASVHAKNRWGGGVVVQALCTARHQVVEQLLAYGAPRSNWLLLSAATMGSGAPCMEAIFAARSDEVDTEVRLPFGCCNPLGLLLAALALPHLLWGSKRHMALLGYHSPGATPLMLAALTGHVAEARVLLAAGADPSARNTHGRNARELAEIVGLNQRSSAYFGGIEREPPPQFRS